MCEDFRDLEDGFVYNVDIKVFNKFLKTCVGRKNTQH